MGIDGINQSGELITITPSRAPGPLVESHTTKVHCTTKVHGCMQVHFLRTMQVHFLKTRACLEAVLHISDMLYY